MASDRRERKLWLSRPAHIVCLKSNGVADHSSLLLCQQCPLLRCAVAVTLGNFQASFAGTWFYWGRGSAWLSCMNVIPTHCH